jgi:hypothetical protein
MSETAQEAQEGVADALRDLSDNSRALVRHEITAAQQEMWGKAKQALPAAGLLGAAACCGALSVAALFRFSIKVLEKSLSPAAAAFTAAAGYGVAAGVAGALGRQKLRQAPPLFPAETIREAVTTAADTTARAAEG